MNRRSGFGRVIRVALSVLGIVAIGVVAVPGLAGAAASVTTAFDAATCDLVISGTGFTAADVGSQTTLPVRGVFVTPHSVTDNFTSAVPAADALDDGAWTLRIPAADVGANSGIIFVDTAPGEVKAADLVSPCVSQPAYLDAQGLILSGQEGIATGYGPVEFQATVNGFPCSFATGNAAISIIDGKAVIGEDHIQGTCVVPPGASLPTGAGEVTSAVVYPGPGSGSGYGGTVSGATVVGVVCGTATCLTATGPSIAEPLCRTTLTMYLRCEPIAILIDFTLPTVTSSTQPDDGAIYFDVTTDSGDTYSCAATFQYRSLGGGQYDVSGPAGGDCGSMYGSTAVVSLVVRGLGPVPPADSVEPIGPYTGSVLQCVDPTAECLWRLTDYPYTTAPIAVPIPATPKFTG